MKIVLIAIGKTQKQYLVAGLHEYQARLKKYISFEIKEIADIKKFKNLSKLELISKQGELILGQLLDSDYVILLDDQGKTLSSVRFADKLQIWMMNSKKRLVFLVGGAYGISKAVYGRADYELSLSKMTFSHQMVRLFFIEQLYRAFTILNNQPYHHD